MSVPMIIVGIYVWSFDSVFGTSLSIIRRLDIKLRSSEMTEFLNSLFQKKIIFTSICKTFLSDFRSTI